MIEPDYGFGVIKPNEKKLLKITFSPDVNDLPLMKSIDGVHELITKITLSTVKDLGGIKEDLVRSEMNKHKKQIKKKELIVNEGQGQGDGCLCPDPFKCFYEILPEGFSDYY